MPLVQAEQRTISPSHTITNEVLVGLVPCMQSLFVIGTVKLGRLWSVTD